MWLDVYDTIAIISDDKMEVLCGGEAEYMISFLHWPALWRKSSIEGL